MRFAKLVVSQGLGQLDPETGAWLAGVIADQDPDRMVAAWRETMAFDSRPRLAEIRCPTLIVAATMDEAVPMHHAQMLHDGILGSQRVVLEGADHALVWTHAARLLEVTEAFLGVG